MNNNKIQAKKGNQTRFFTTHVWDLLPPNKNGWQAINIPIETPKEVTKVVKDAEAPPEVAIPLPPKVSIKPKAKAKSK